MSSDESDLSVHPLIAKLDPQPGDTRRFLTLFGYVGPTWEKGFTTFYLDLDLGCYLLIPEDRILCAEAAIPGQRYGPTKLIVDAEAEITRVEIKRRKVDFRFLNGSITEANLGKATADGDTVTLFQTGPAAKALIHNSAVGPTKPMPVSFCTLGGQCVSSPFMPPWEP